MAERADEAGDRPEGDGRARHDGAFPIALLAVLVVVVAAFGARVTQVSSYTGRDELQHVDAIYKAAHGDFPGYGSQVSDAVSRDVACRGLDRHEVSSPPVAPTRSWGTCGQLSTLPEGGESYESGQPQLYYLMGGVLDRVLWTFGDESPNLAALRWLNLVWLIGAFLIVLDSVRRVANRWVSLLAVGAFFLNPAVLESAATVSNDVAVLAVGAVFAWFAVRGPELSVRRRWWVGLAIGLLAGGVKSTTVLPVIAVTLALLAQAIIERDTRVRRLRTALAPALGWAIATAVWGAYVIAVSKVLPPDLAPFNRALPGTSSLQVALVQSLRPVGPLQLVYAPGVDTDSLFSFQLLGATTPLLILGVGYSLLRWQSLWDSYLDRRVTRSSRTLVVAFATAVIFFLGGIPVAILSRLGTGVAHNVQPRFTLGMVGLLTLAIASQSDRRVSRGQVRFLPVFPVLVALSLMTAISLVSYLFAIE